MNLRSSLYVGNVFHHRLRPRTHKLRHRAFWMLIDLDEIDEMASRLKLFSYNRFNLASLYDTDHGNGSSTPLRRQVEERLRAAGYGSDGGRIELFCMPRILGYGFNPLSVYFCHRRDGSLSALIYEVHNTFGERHNYVLPCAGADDQVIEQKCTKDFYVSPFLDMDMHYAFRVERPRERVKINVEGKDRKGSIIVAALMGARVPLTDGSLLWTSISHPLLTLSVIFAIHWQALRMLLKGFRPRKHVPAANPLD